MGHFKPVLLSSRISANYVNPGESLWVTLVWQNQGDNPAERDFRFFSKGGMAIRDGLKIKATILWKRRKRCHKLLSGVLAKRLQ